MRNYYPIFKSKQGEFSAIERLNMRITQNTTPIIELVGEISKALGATSSFVEKCLQSESKILVDPTYIINDINAEILVKSLFKKSSDVNIKAIPVLLNLENSWLCDLATTNANGVAIRLKSHLLNRNTIESYLIRIANSLNLDYNNITVILDAGVIDKDSGYFTGLMNDCIHKVQSLGQFQEIIFAGGSFPKNLGDIQASAEIHLPRYEWRIWNELDHASFIKPIAYADYGIKHPELSTDAFEGTVSMKYTTKDTFYIIKGVKASTSVLGNNQYNQHCKQLVEQNFYDGQFYCDGDTKIFNCTLSERYPGNATTWVQNGHNHHITKIVDLLST